MNKSQSTPELPSMGFVRVKQILKVFPVSKTRWWEGVKQGIYPAPVKLSKRTKAWRVDDIKQLIERLDREGHAER